MSFLASVFSYELQFPDYLLSLRCFSIILPTLTSLAGFLIVNLISRINPEYPALTLSLDLNNPDVSTNRNPIPYNNPGIYNCQPGKCIYGRSNTSVTETSEQYFFCGEHAKVSLDWAETCTITDSSSIISQVSQFGSFGVGNDVTDIVNVSASIVQCITCNYVSHNLHPLVKRERFRHVKRF